MMAAFDDPATKYFRRRTFLPIRELSSPCTSSHAALSPPLMRRLNDEARQLISDLGSSIISTLGFRDSWIFVGGKGIKTKTPFEQVTQARLAHNKEHHSPPLKSSALLLLFPLCAWNPFVECRLQMATPDTPEPETRGRMSDCVLNQLLRGKMALT